jgi:hypothetical protein
LNASANFCSFECGLAKQLFYRDRVPMRLYTWGNSGLEPHSGSENQLSGNAQG